MGCISERVSLVFYRVKVKQVKKYFRFCYYSLTIQLVLSTHGLCFLPRLAQRAENMSINSCGSFPSRSNSEICGERAKLMLIGGCIANVLTLSWSDHFY